MKVRVIAASLLVSTVLLSVFVDQTKVTAFAISSISSSSNIKTSTRPLTTIHNNMVSDNNKTPNNNENLKEDLVLRLRGGGNAGAAAAAAPAPPAPKKKIRIPALDGMRFLLATHIVLGHFLRFANPSEFWLKFFTQVNVSVGAFFALSGYVSAYTTTEVGKYEASSRLTETPSQKWFLSKVMGFYPMHWLVCLLFSPMFLYSDIKYSGIPTAIWNGIMSMTLTQAWLPMHAEIWNAPTWFLSSLVFSTSILPFVLPKIATMKKKSLRKTTFWLFVIRLLPILGYVHDHNTWQLLEGMTAPKYHPALAVFNGLRFSPLLNTVEMLMGVVVCRLCMLDGMEDSKDEKPVKTNSLSTAIPVIGLFAILAGRSVNFIPGINDMLARSVLFVPLFLKFVMASHRNAVAGIQDPVSGFLSSKAMVWLGGFTFPIFVLHGPIGQVFYKKLIATKLWGKVLMGPEYFAVFLGTVFVSSWLLKTLFLDNKAVSTWSNKRVEQWSQWM